MNNAGAKNKFIGHYNGHMILGFSCKLNFEGEKKLPCTVQQIAKVQISSLSNTC